ncbi:hypothetical protein BU23DRAFT_564222 [Bimuria novae-zelandiae CBS 107.79]|uniref:BZIP domain-containing protein n=1 Tax=Bimuria novae-zelandiae CBS 107.79 TaxID=1447943 RepID=A0A6A5VPZ8_9PLEO|nr:hypothetical protein BU23DRAFT_564222 [Bimuria novae-zelandiae CBS 107.79]
MTESEAAEFRRKNNEASKKSKAKKRQQVRAAREARLRLEQGESNVGGAINDHASKRKRSLSHNPQNVDNHAAETASKPGSGTAAAMYSSSSSANSDDHINKRARLDPPTAAEGDAQEDSAQEDSAQEDSAQEDSAQEDSAQEDSAQEDDTDVYTAVRKLRAAQKPIAPRAKGMDVRSDSYGNWTDPPLLMEYQVRWYLRHGPQMPSAREGRVLFVRRKKVGMVRGKAEGIGVEKVVVSRRCWRGKYKNVRR